MAPRLLTPRNSLVLPSGLRKPAKPILDTTHPLSRGLVGLYLLGDNPGRANDLSFSANSGSYQNSPTLIAGHHGGTGTTFNGSTQIGTAPANLKQSVNKFTVGAWAQVTGGAGNQRGIVGKCTLTGNLRNYNILARASGTWGTYFTQGSNNFKGFDGSIAIVNNVWTFVVSTYDGTTLTLFVDCVSAGSVAPTGNPDAAATINEVVALGASTGSQELFQGNVEGVRIYDRALSLDEIRQWYAQPYAGIYNAGPVYRVGVSAGGGGTARSRAYIFG